MAEARLQVRQLSKSYGRVRVIHGINFSLRSGELCGYLGANGSGKSTTIRMLTGLLPPSGGEVLYDGRSIAADPYRYRAQLGYVPEEPYLYSHLSAVEYLELVGGLRGLAAPALRKKIDGVLELLGLGGVAGEAAIETYSKGMKQKVLLAGALLHNPEVLILDEPFGGLDAVSMRLVEHLLKILAARGKLILLSSHILDLVSRMCARVLVLHQGRIVADDAVANLGALMQLPSLQAIFEQLTAQPDIEGRATELANLVSG